MNAPASPTTRYAARTVLMFCLLDASVLVPMAALAQASACDQLKATLAARIDATGVRGYSLEAVPAATPVPAGAKAIGNCESGERKILYRRWGGASAPARAEAVAAPASAPGTAPEPPPKRPPPAARPALPAPVASLPAAKPVPVPAPVLTPEAAKPVPSPAAQATPAEPNPQAPSLSRQAAGFVATHWRWLLALLLVPLAALGWAWRAHHRAYDKNGLPRGPRL